MNEFEYIDRNLSDAIRTATIAERLHISESYICHEFRRCTGSTVSEYITSKRIAKAKELGLHSVIIGKAIYEGRITLNNIKEWLQNE